MINLFKKKGKPKTLKSRQTKTKKIMGFIMVILYLAFIVFMIASVWKVFTKAGQPGWAAIVPIYNIVVMLKIIGKPTWWIAIILLVPIVNYIFLIWMINLISKSFGKGVGFTLGLLFLGPIFWPILGFGSATYVGPAGAPQTAPAAAPAPAAPAPAATPEAPAAEETKTEE